MGKARPAVVVWALASSATPPAGRARIRHRLVKLVISKATFVVPWHGRVWLEQQHTPAKASCAGWFQADSCPSSEPLCCLLGQLSTRSLRHHHTHVFQYLWE